MFTHTSRIAGSSVTLHTAEAVKPLRPAGPSLVNATQVYISNVLTAPENTYGQFTTWATPTLGGPNLLTFDGSGVGTFLNAGQYLLTYVYPNYGGGSNYQAVIDTTLSGGAVFPVAFNPTASSIGSRTSTLQTDMIESASLQVKVPTGAEGVASIAISMKILNGGAGVGFPFVYLQVARITANA